MSDLLEKPVLYESDFYLWTQAQARLLREQATRRVNSHLDLENLAEEIESLGQRDRAAIENRLRRVLEHLLKLQYSPAQQPRHGWRRTIIEQRARIHAITRQSPSLRRHQPELFASAWPTAVKLASEGLAHDGLSLPTDLAPTITLEQALDEDWWPEEPE